MAGKRKSENEPSYKKQKKIETPEEREKRLERDRENRKRKLALETPEQREIRLAKQRERQKNYRDKQSAEKRNERLEQHRTHMQNKRSSESEDERQKRLRVDNLNHKKLLQNETDNERRNRLDRVLSYQLDRIQKETNEERHNRLSYALTYHFERTQNETDDERRDRLYRALSYQHVRLQNETEDQRRNRLDRALSNQNERLQKETEDQRQSRLERALSYQNVRLEIETEEERQIRLEYAREYQRECRTRQSADAQNFERAINVVCDKICDICLKRCYPNQASTLTLSCNIPSYLPPELSNKNQLTLCYRCKTHLTSKRNDAPSRAYWNNMDPGAIPDEIQILTQPEQRVLSQIYPFTKIVKYGGRFGQFGFVGNAILFGMDVTEITEKLRTTLPRQTNDIGMMIIAEHLENSNIVREYSINRDRTFRALRWLKENNPLYKNVNVDESVDLSQADYMRAEEPEAEEEKEVSAFTEIRPFSRIIRASYHQGTRPIFNSQTAGKQGASMALANIVRASFLPPSQWNTNILNANMIQGDRIQQKIGQLIPDIDKGEYLSVLNFNAIKDKIMMFNKVFSIQFESDSLLAISGNLLNNKNTCKNRKTGNIIKVGDNLLEGLQKLFQDHNGGILTAQSKSYGLIKSSEKFYFTDSHGCGPKGSAAKKNGNACVIECDNITELAYICRRATKNLNSIYFIHYITVTLQSETISDVLDDVCNASNQEVNKCTAENGDFDKNQPDMIINDLEVNSNMETTRSASPALIIQNESSIAQSRVLQATHHQGNRNVFHPSSAGKQCTAMALANIVTSIIIPPSQWTINTLNATLFQGDLLYRRIINLTDPENIPASGFLYVRNFDVIRNGFNLHGLRFSINFENDSSIFGSLDSNFNENNLGIDLIDGLVHLFSNHQGGILIVNSKSFGLLRHGAKYYFTDSHACDSDGKPNTEIYQNGSACIIECDNIRELHRICRRTVGHLNTQYTIDSIEVTFQDNNDNQLTLSLPNNLSQPGEDLVNWKSIRQYIHNSSKSNQNKDLHFVWNNVEENNYNIGPRNYDFVPLHTYLSIPIDYNQVEVQDEFEVSNKIHEIHRKTNNNIVNVSHEPRAEELSWFYLFPYGINGLNERRNVPITPLDYFQHRILGKDTRFERTDYLFYALSFYEYMRVKTNIACGKVVQGNKEMVDDVHLYMTNLRGSAAYWRRAYNELIAKIRFLGPPHYFVTFSCNDLNWLDMRRALLHRDGRPEMDPSTLSIDEVQKLIEKYPVVVSRHFMLRVNEMMKFLKNNDQVFGGKLKDFWWRIEIQNRGSPHLHMVVWIEDYPSFDTEEGILLIDQVCKCILPGDEDQELRDLVEKCQRHHHTATCTKNTSSNCRFSFPRQECEETHLINHTSDELIRNGGRICILKRRKQDAFINNYNPTLLKLWKGNMDIQPCGKNEAIASYVAKYVSKSEPTTMTSELAQAIRQIQRDKDLDVSQKMYRICMRIMKERQVSACECAFRLCHLPMRDSSRKCIFLNTRKKDTRYKVLKFNHDGAATEFCANIFDRYENRPRSRLGEHQNFPEFNFEDMSLYEFASKFEPHYPKNKNDLEVNVDDDAYEMPESAKQKRRLLILGEGRNRMIMALRNTPAIIRVPYFRIPEDEENYCYSLLLQYMPFRTEEELLQGHPNAKAAFIANEARMRELCREMNAHIDCERQLREAINQINAFEEVDNRDCEPVELDLAEEEMEEYLMNDEEFQRGKNAMNTKQTEIFNLITASVRQQMRQHIQENIDKLRLFITGGGGVGKSFLLHMLKNQINRLYNKIAVKVCALTGVAARLIGGCTLHSTLKLPVQKDGKLETLPQLTGNYLQQMRNQWRDVEFLFVDEISMVPYEMLAMIDLRLRELKNNDLPFGGINVVFFGDLFQLPPVRGSAVFKQPLIARPAIHLWREFKLCELTENMRQQGDNTFIDVLNALRVGQLTSDHMQILLDKVSTNFDGEFSIGRALRIYPTNDQVNEHNQAVLQLYKSKNTTMFKVIAEDRLEKDRREIPEEIYDTIIPSSINNTGGIPRELDVFIGAKVMLRSNVDVSRGLVNGAIGFITEIIWPHNRRIQVDPRDIPAVRIDFGRDGEHVIQPRTVEFDSKYKNGKVHRRMIPIVHAWASTVHKMQGSTVDYAVVYLGSRLFAEGQAYVALSRVRSLDGLLIEDLDCSKLIGTKPCNLAALEEMNRLRGLGEETLQNNLFEDDIHSERSNDDFEYNEEEMDELLLNLQYEE